MTQESHSTELKVGLFVIMVVVTALSLLVYIGIKKDLFAERAVFYTVTDTGEGIEPGIAIRLKGFKIGQVTDVALQDINTVRITLQVLKNHVRWFKRDATLSLDRPLIGGAFLNLAPGQEHSPVLSPGSVISMQKSEDLQEKLKLEVQAMLKEVQQVVSNVRIISDQVVDPQGPVQTVLANLEQISSSLASEDGMLAYMTSPGPARRMDGILRNTESATGNMDVLLKTANSRVEDLRPIQREVEQLVKEVNTIVVEYQGLRETIEPILVNTASITENVDGITEEVHNATKGLAGLRARGEYTLRLGTSLLQRLNETWPLSRREDSSPLEIRHPAP